MRSDSTTVSIRARKPLPVLSPAMESEPAAPVASVFAPATPPSERYVPRRTRAQGLLKRALDLAITMPMTAALTPLMLGIGLAIRLESPGPALFRQQRRGEGMRPFTMLKFRTMRVGMPDPHERYETLRGDPRITRVGAFLRRTSLDELPQLFNVLEGSMSLVGPRPLVDWESEEALRTHPERYRVPPGITGLAQVTLRNAGDLVARLDNDAEYVRFWSLGLDLEILARTPTAILSGRNLYPERAL